MNDENTSVGSGLSKPELVLEFWAFRSRFLGYIRQRVSNGCTEDIFQEACAKFLTSEAVFVYPQAGTRYFCRILRSLIADHFERAWRLEYRENVPEPSWDPWPEEEERQLTERVCEAFERLRVCRSRRPEDARGLGRQGGRRGQQEPPVSEPGCGPDRPLPAECRRRRGLCWRGLAALPTGPGADR